MFISADMFVLLWGLATLLPCLMLIPPLVYARKNSQKLLCRKISPYHHIGVFEDPVKKERYIYTGKMSELQGAVSLDDPENLLFEYTRTAFVSLAFLDRVPENVLFVGLGSGAMQKYFHKFYPDAYIDIVEIDQNILDMAKNFFYFEEDSKMNVFIDDGRSFIEKSMKEYDIIFLDAYKSGGIPFHLTTVEFLREINGRLKDGGVVASNILSRFENNYFDSMAVTYKRVFPHLYIFKVRRSNNMIFIAAKGKVFKYGSEISKKAEKIRSSRKMDIDLRRLSMCCVDSAGYSTTAEILTDDFPGTNKCTRSGRVSFSHNIS